MNTNWMHGLRALVCALAMTGGLAQAKEVAVQAVLATPVVKAGETQTTFLKVALTGFALPASGARTPANVAIVIDRSGSMAGEKMARAREAATMAVQSLSEQDVVSVVAFDDVVEVITPATRATEKAAITRSIAQIDSRGSTALFAGVSKGASEVRKFFDKTRVNRVILLSDGQANVGPRSPAELGELGSTLAREGISVTTIGLGLGYNEDLMTQLAGFSDGNHAFVANAQDLARIFRLEFGDVSSIVAQEVEVQIHLGNQVRPLRVLGRDSDIQGQVVRTRMNQLGSEQEKFLVLEVEIPPGKNGANLNVANVEVRYLNMHSKKQDQLRKTVSASYSDSATKVSAATDKKAMASAVKQVSNLLNKQAIKYRDEGKTEEARRTLNESADYLKKNAVELDADDLKSMEQQTRSQAATIDKGEWNSQRKSMKEQQYKLEKQQKY